MHVDTDLTITGRLARFGRGGMIQDVSKRLLGDFAACLQAELKGSGGVDRTDQIGDPPIEARSGRTAPAVPGEVSRPLPGVLLVLSVIRDRIRRFLSRRRGGPGA